MGFFVLIRLSDKNNDTERKYVENKKPPSGSTSMKSSVLILGNGWQ